MEKLSYFFIDDVIWVFRDIARQKPKSIFDNEYMKMLKRAHDDNGLTVQLNLFYRTDFFYGNDEFTLSEMPDTYKAEFQANKDWLRLAFHAKQEFPDYPYVNATYQDVYDNFKTIESEVERFAGPGMYADVLCTHWLPLSKDACKALVDCGIRLVSPSVGDKWEFDGDESKLPYGHAARLKQNRQPETMLFTRQTNDARIRASICGYNHVSSEEFEPCRWRNYSIKDKELNLGYRQLGGGPCLNLYTLEEIEARLNELIAQDLEYIGVATHEQYYYPDYLAYQPDTPEKVYLMSKILHDAGYRFVTCDELK